MTDLPHGNRLGRALCELIEHLPTDRLPQHGVANATIIVTVEETKLRNGAGEALLDTGGSLSVGETRRLACNAGPGLDRGTSPHPLERRRSDRPRQRLLVVFVPPPPDPSGRWDLTLAPDGITDVIPPTRIDPNEDPSATNASNPDPASPGVSREVGVMSPSMSRGAHRVLTGLGRGWHNPVRLWIDFEANRIYLDLAFEPRASDSVSAVHQPSISCEDHGIPKIGIGDPTGVLRYLSARGRLAPEPAVFVEFHDVCDRHLDHRQTRCRCPEILRPPEPPAAGHRARVLLSHA